MDFNLLTYQTLDSTNEEAIRLYQKGDLTIPTVISANYQSEGKGYGNNFWESAAGKNLTFSIACFPEFIEPSDQFVLTQIISLSLLEVVSEVIRDKHITIKWPNDLYVADKKIAGVLIRNFIKSNKIDFSVIGVGLNVKQKIFHSDAPNPTSLAIEAGQIFQTEVILKNILQRFGSYMNELTSPAQPESINNLYVKNLYRLKQPNRYKDIEGVFTAEIVGINEFGQLKLISKDGREQVYGFKEVEFL